MAKVDVFQKKKIMAKLPPNLHLESEMRCYNAEWRFFMMINGINLMRGLLNVNSYFL